MRVLVCGASGGIGAACLELGHQAVGVDRDAVDFTPGGVEKAVDTVDFTPGGVEKAVDAIDITLPGGAERAVAHAVERLGGLDGIVHAVGMSGRALGDGPVGACTDAAWAEVHRVNLESVFRLLRAGLPALSRQGGSIVVVGSALSRTLDDDFLTAAYAVSKSAVETLVRVAAREGAPHGVRVNVVAPGLVDTPMAARALSDPRLRRRLPQLMPLGARPCTAAEVAAAIGWLLSPASARVTGAVVPVDGGWTLR